MSINIQSIFSHMLTEKQILDVRLQVDMTMITARRDRSNISRRKLTTETLQRM